jgi:hypothetical protein
VPPLEPEVVPPELPPDPDAEPPELEPLPELESAPVFPVLEPHEKTRPTAIAATIEEASVIVFAGERGRVIPSMLRLKRPAAQDVGQGSGDIHPPPFGATRHAPSEGQNLREVWLEDGVLIECVPA